MSWGDIATIAGGVALLTLVFIGFRGVTRQAETTPTTTAPAHSAARETGRPTTRALSALAESEWGFPKVGKS